MVRRTARRHRIVIRANLLPQSKRRFGIGAVSLESASIKELSIALAIVVLVGVVGIAIESLRARSLEQTALLLEGRIASSSRARAQAKSLALDVARFQEFQREERLHRTSGGDAAAAIASIGNVVPRSAWLDSIAHDRGQRVRRHRRFALRRDRRRRRSRLASGDARTRGVARTHRRPRPGRHPLRRARRVARDTRAGCVARGGSTLTAMRSLDIGRIVRISGFVAAVAVACAVYVVETPAIDALQQRVDEDSATLESDRVMTLAIPQFRVRRDALARSYQHRFSENAQAVFIRDLTANVARHRVRLVSADVHATREDARPAVPASPLFRAVAIDVSLEGGYANVLETVADMSLGGAIVEVDAPTLRHADGNDVDAVVPAVLYIPNDRLPVRPATLGGSP